MLYALTSELKSYQDHKLWRPQDLVASAQLRIQYSASGQGRDHAGKMEEGQMGMHQVGGEIC